MNLLHLLNPARIPYFDRKWHQYIDGLDEKRPQIAFLDVGCGGGIATEALALLGYNMTGIDISERSILAARQHAAEHNVSNVRYLVGSAYELPFADGTFDGVISSDVLEHIHDLRRMVREIRRVLKPRGVFVFDTINRSWMSYIVTIVGAQELLGVLPRRTHDWRLYITPEELTQLLRSEGFEVHDEDFVGMRPSLNLGRLFDGLIPGLLGDFVETSDLSMNYLGTAIRK